MKVIKQVMLTSSDKHYWHKNLVGEVLNVVGEDSGIRLYHVVALTPEQQAKVIRESHFVVDPKFCKDHRVITNNQEALILLRR